MAHATGGMGEGRGGGQGDHAFPLSYKKVFKKITYENQVAIFGTIFKNCSKNDFMVISALLMFLFCSYFLENLSLIVLSKKEYKSRFYNSASFPLAASLKIKKLKTMKPLQSR